MCVCGYVCVWLCVCVCVCVAMCVCVCVCADGTRNVPENSAIGVAVGDPVSGDDVDAGQSLTYRITSQSVEGIFRIDALTGQIEVSSPSLNYEVEPRTYDLRIEARDNGAGQLTASATYTMYVGMAPLRNCFSPTQY